MTELPSSIPSESAALERRPIVFAITALARAALRSSLEVAFPFQKRKLVLQILMLDSFTGLGESRASE
jgi:hypothetical protein